MLKDMPQGQADIIRVNPEYSSNTLTEGLDETLIKEHIVSLPAGALAVLEAIDNKRK